MGTDTPLAVLSDRPQLLFNYFKQLFAQVTNPPIDPIREELVMSLDQLPSARERNLLDETPRALPPAQARAADPDQRRPREAPRSVDVGELPRRARCRCCSAVDGGGAGLRAALDDAVPAGRRGGRGRATRCSSCPTAASTREHAPIPSLLATAAVHHHLIREGTRTQLRPGRRAASRARCMHFALLIGYGAGAVNPYLAFETLDDMHRQGLLPQGVDLEQAEQNYIKAVNKGC